MKRWISEKARRGISAAAALLLTASAAVSACALGEPNITADTTIGEIRANESIIGSGFNTMDRSAYWPEQPWEYTSWTLQEYLGDCAPDAAAGLNLLIENYNSGVQVTYKIYTPEEIAEMHDHNENFNGTQANFEKVQLYHAIRNDLIEFMSLCDDVHLIDGYNPNTREKHAILWLDFSPAATLDKEEIAALVAIMQKSDGVVISAVDGHARISFDVNNIWKN